MSERPSNAGPRSTASERSGERGLDDREPTKKKVVRRPKGLAPSLVASGSIVDARQTSLETPAPRRRPWRSSGKK